MSRRRIRHGVDANQAAIVKALRACGATVDIIGEPVDLLVGWKGANLLMEVKDGPKAKLTDSQVAFFRTWRGQVARVDSVDAALAAIGAKR